MLAAKAFFRRLSDTRQLDGIPHEDYNLELFKAFTMNEFAFDLHFAVLGVILARDFHVIVDCLVELTLAAPVVDGRSGPRIHTGRLRYNGSNQGLGQMSLAQLKDVYAEKAEGLPGHQLVPSLFLLGHHDTSRQPLYIQHHINHYTALLLTTNTDHNSLPRPFITENLGYEGSATIKCLSITAGLG